MEKVTLEALVESIIIMVEGYEKAHHCILWIDNRERNFLTDVLKENRIREAIIDERG